MLHLVEIGALDLSLPLWRWWRGVAGLVNKRFCWCCQFYFKGPISTAPPPPKRLNFCFPGWGFSLTFLVPAQSNQAAAVRPVTKKRALELLVEPSVTTGLEPASLPSFFPSSPRDWRLLRSVSGWIFLPIWVKLEKIKFNIWYSLFLLLLHQINCDWVPN